VPDLTPITALGAPAPRAETFGALTISENADLALASLALRRGTDTPAPFGLTLPGPGGWVSGEVVAAFWTGPGQWMIEAPGRAEEEFAAELRRAAPGASVTEQTDGWAAFEIESASGALPLIRLMEKLVNLDPDSLMPGRANRTLLDHMSVYLIRRAEDRLAVLGMRSAAGSLWHALATAAGRRDAPLP
jgi:heterotetrameric sarcosine oxidase gamma subunit